MTGSSTHGYMTSPAETRNKREKPISGGRDARKTMLRQVTGRIAYGGNGGHVV